MQIFTGFILAAAVSTAAYFTRSLTAGGALAAALLGTIIFGLGGLPWAVLMLVFFISSSLLSHLRRRTKAALDDRFSKTSRRDAWQVAANGAVPGLAVLAHLALPGAAWPWLTFSGALAAVNADTWATEIGVLGKGSPRLITSWRTVERGASGAVSLTGTLAAAAGAFAIGLPAALFWQGASHLAFPSGTIMVILVVTAAGLAGCLVDSLLGATGQALFFCPSCGRETERHPIHKCGSPTTLRRGLPWLNNDAVNAACSLSGAILAAAGLLFPGPVPGTEGGLPMPEIIVSSTAFHNGAAIPPEYSCERANSSPALAWSGLPPGVKSLALVADDPDAPLGVFTHWVIYNLDAGLSGLPPGVPKQEQAPGLGTQGRNSFGKVGYDGPCPPRGQTHRYYFKLYALDLQPSLPAGLDSAGLQRAMQGHILGQGQWMGTFKR